LQLGYEPFPKDESHDGPSVSLPCKLGGTDFIATNNLAHYNTELIAAVKSLVEDKKALLICPVLSPTGPSSFFLSQA
jgi:hypothetical protein